MRPPLLRLEVDEIVVDNFAGGGGASTGLEWAIKRSPDIAINHDPKAIAMHRANHPNTEHYCESVWDVDPVKACRGRRVGLAWFSPDCTFHSKARGGKPFRDRKKANRRRGLAGVVVRWARLERPIKPRIICLENVEEFKDWGPLLKNGKICQKRKGSYFRRWVRDLERAGFKVKWWLLRACDYGAPTTRKRLFVVQIVNICMRMVKPRELFNAHRFPRDYQIDIAVGETVTKKGKRKVKKLSAEAQVRMVGNSVPPDLACAVAAAQLYENAQEMAA